MKQNTTRNTKCSQQCGATGTQSNYFRINKAKISHQKLVVKQTYFPSLKANRQKALKKYRYLSLISSPNSNSRLVGLGYTPDPDPSRLIKIHKCFQEPLKHSYFEPHHCTSSQYLQILFQINSFLPSLCPLPSNSNQMNSQVELRPSMTFRLFFSKQCP